jgi:hypothetical protein
MNILWPGALVLIAWPLTASPKQETTPDVPSAHA